MDTQLFLLINHLPHTWITDSVAQFLSGIGSAGLIWLVIGLVLYVRQEQKHHAFFLPFGVAGVVSFFMVDYIMKPLIGRIRPTVEMGAIIVGEGKTDFSMPSGHATIAFALAVVLSHYEPKYRNWFYALAVFISLSRVYLGVHFPGDIVAGALLGYAIGRVSILLFFRKHKA